MDDEKKKKRIATVGVAVLLAAAAVLIAHMIFSANAEKLTDGAGFYIPLAADNDCVVVEDGAEAIEKLASAINYATQAISVLTVVYLIVAFIAVLLAANVIKEGQKDMKIKKWDDVNGVDESKERMVAFLDSTTNGYAIMQLRRVDETAEERFIPYVDLKRQGKEPSFDHYEVVYVGSLPSNISDLAPEDLTHQLEDLYVKFNIERPPDYTGHSLSISDIIALKIRDEVSYHYVDKIGFQRLAHFFEKDNYLKNAEMAMEDDYGMIDGIINNGKKEEPAEPERPSVLEKLKEYKSNLSVSGDIGEREL